jgi:hypothetical protein
MVKFIYKGSKIKQKISKYTHPSSCTVQATAPGNLIFMPFLQGEKEKLEKVFIFVVVFRFLRDTLTTKKVKEK